MTDSAWHYDEFKQIGTDYESVEEVAIYDDRMSGLRDVTGECSRILELLELAPDSRVLEIGTGTGEFAISAAQVCGHVCAVDVSQVMLDYAQKKACDKNINNITFTRAGFLTYDHNGQPFDAVVSQLALHHLPDFWKAIALRRICHILKDGGRFFLKDVVFSFDVDDAPKHINNWIDGVAKFGGDELGKDVESHVRQEFSTFGWIMERLLQKAGFSIVNTSYNEEHTFAEYLCRKD
jgi:putative AdoMet-dependent methyltransferase